MGAFIFMGSKRKTIIMIRDLLTPLNDRKHIVRTRYGKDIYSLHLKSYNCIENEEEEELREDGKEK